MELDGLHSGGRAADLEEEEEAPPKVCKIQLQIPLPPSSRLGRTRSKRSSQPWSARRCAAPDLRASIVRTCLNQNSQLIPGLTGNSAHGDVLCALLCSCPGFCMRAPRRVGATECVGIGSKLQRGLLP